MLSFATIDRQDDLSVQFQTGKPFKCVCIDDFFQQECAENIVQDFPDFQQVVKADENGNERLKAVHENLSDISPFYSRLTDYFYSEAFHEVIRHITGIPDLRWGGESMYGGGTHENVNDAELDAHVDFNYDDRTKEHRRLNLPIYLNKEWQADWGGELELHSNPRAPKENQVTSFLPLFNRAVIMETSEHSWHGFPRIQLPDDKRHLSRKSLALYFYTNDRPSHEIQGGHTTVYIQRPLPESFKPGIVVTADMRREIKRLISRRDKNLEVYQKREIQTSVHFRSLESQYQYVLSRLRLPILGWALQDGAVQGYYPDNWIGDHCSGVFVARQVLSTVSLQFYAPEHASFPMTVKFAIENHFSSMELSRGGMYDMAVAISAQPGDSLMMLISASSTMSGLRAGVNSDNREVSVLLQHLCFQ